MRRDRAQQERELPLREGPLPISSGADTATVITCRFGPRRVQDVCTPLPLEAVLSYGPALLALAEEDGTAPGGAG